MKIKQKVYLTIFMMLIITSALWALGAKFIFLNSFKQLEQREALLNAERATAAFENLRNEVSMKVLDWSNWDELYKFADHKKPGFAKTDITADAVDLLNIDFLIVYDTNDEIVGFANVDPETKKFADVPVNVLRELKNNPSLFRKSETNQVQKGILKAGDHILFVASNTILTSQKKGPSHGTLIFGRFVKKADFEKISEYTHLTVHQEVPSPELLLHGKKNMNQYFYEIQSSDDDGIDVLSIVYDLKRQPAIAISTETGRYISNVGRKTLIESFLGLLCIIIISSFVGVLFLQKEVLHRIIRLMSNVKKLNDENVEPSQVLEKGSDEIAELSQSINEMFHAKQSASEKMLAYVRTTAISEMTQGMAHEVNNPLAIIDGLSDHLITSIEYNEATLPEVEKIARRLREATQRLSRTFHNWRTLTREAAYDPVEAASVLQIVQNAESFVSEKLRLHNITFAAPTLKAPIYVRCRPTQISQVLINLINNSIEAIDKERNKWISIEVVESDSWLELAVVDSGHGVPKEYHDRILSPFFTSKGETSGTGLGLSFAKNVVESIGGSFYLDTNAKNTRFVLKLPYSKARLQNSAA